MKLLLDECVPRRLKTHFHAHEVLTVIEAGFQGLQKDAYCNPPPTPVLKSSLQLTKT
jgi:hypothetical protein